MKIENQANMVWAQLCEIRPRLVRFDPPKIELTRRFWRTAGQCHQEQNRVSLGVKFLEYSQKYRAHMLRVILPHELIHQADWNLYGPSDRPCGHGVQWTQLMKEYGLPANQFHHMDIPRC